MGSPSWNSARSATLAIPPVAAQEGVLADRSLVPDPDAYRSLKFPESLHGHQEPAVFSGRSRDLWAAVDVHDDLQSAVRSVGVVGPAAWPIGESPAVLVAERTDSADSGMHSGSGSKDQPSSP